MDCCCGYGYFAFEILQQLKEASVPVEKIIGFDISEEVIALAK